MLLRGLSGFINRNPVTVTIGIRIIRITGNGGRVDQLISKRTQLRNENTFGSASLKRTHCDRPIRAAAQASHVGAAGGVHGNAVTLVVDSAAEVTASSSIPT